MTFNITDLIERIKTICPLKSLESIGYNASTISGWKTNNRPPRSDDLYTIAKHLNVSMEWLLTGESDSEELPPEELEILSSFRQLTPEQKAMITIQVNAIASSN